ncbi:MAG: 3-methyl-2-oxobutanoate hydroxymethyltransferase [Dethiobacter sp.]|jgi:3-methyl-2-oxobutanoate hydroxymethyltransferase|nr:MAG: 3-methyl-2-oxobutanoate hydroxymethyltransferase [Dethiobacter sp.]
MSAERFTTLDFKEMKQRKEKIAMVTAYDYPTAQLVDEAGVEFILVGDSLGMVVLGYEDTLAVTLNDMIHHGKAVVRGSKKAFVVVDMPFLTYQVNNEDALRNAGRIIQETGAQGVKLEGGLEIVGAVKSITRAGIPVMGHLGLTPQSAGQLGGFKVQGKDPRVAKKMMEDSLVIEDAGAFSLVLECVPWQLAKAISEQLSIPVIGIGAGKFCDGQVLVYHDVMGLYTGKRPKFVKQYAEARNEMVKGIIDYISEVKQGSFPEEKHFFTMSEEVLAMVMEE